MTSSVGKAPRLIAGAILGLIFAELVYVIAITRLVSGERLEVVPLTAWVAVPLFYVVAYGVSFVIGSSIRKRMNIVGLGLFGALVGALLAWIDYELPLLSLITGRF